MRVLVAGMGNELRGDDGFGVAVTHLLADRELGAEVTVREFGIGGIHLVQELLTRYDALLIVDAVRRDSTPGTLHLLEPTVVDIADLPDEVRRDFLADLHWADPARVLILAKALGGDFKGKLSMVIYTIAIPLAFVSEWLAVGLYVVVAVMWLVPDRRIEAKLGP